MNNIQIFSNPQFGEIRTSVSESNDPIFCLADVCKALELSNPSQVKTRLKADGLQLIDNHALYNNEGVNTNKLGNTKAIYVNESNLYKCIFQSRTDRAEMFQDWVTSEVLPSIRKMGGYIIANTEDTEAEILARAVLVAHDTLKRREKRIVQLETDNRVLAAVNHEQAEAISEMTPKANYCDIILASPATVLVTEIAQDYGMSACKFNKILNTMGIQRKVGRSWILFAKYLSEGYVQSYTEPNKNSRFGGTFTYTKWTQKGRLFLYNKLKSHGIIPLIEQNCP